MINVTKTFLPPRKEFDKYLKQIWESTWLTNQGPLTKELEKILADRFGVKHVILVNNGTSALQLLYKALELKNNIITTPYSYVATTSSLVWEGLNPIFCDINVNTACPDINLLEKILESETNIGGMVFTHVYGNAGPIEKYEKLAAKYSIPLIFDAAHCFEAKYKNENMVKFGNASTISFHATKLFHTIEGGAVATDDDEIARKVEYMRRFAHDEEGGYYGIGINAKMTEFNAAMGLSVLPYMEKVIEKRKNIFDSYDHFLKEKVDIFKWNEHLTKNYAYYPIFLKDEEAVEKVKKHLFKNQINVRRYFHPSLNLLPYVKGTDCPVSEDLCSRVICLPLDIELSEDDIKYICKTLIEAL